MGIGIRSTDADTFFFRATNNGGSVVTDIENRQYAASMIPDEDDMKSFPVRYGRVSDPDGYIIEIKEAKGSDTDPAIEKVILKVLDLNDSIAFYEGLGLKLLRKRSNGTLFNLHIIYMHCDR